MNFITGIYVINAPASALNNSMGEETKAIVKSIRVQQRQYPYVSAQALRFWLRESVERHVPAWKAAPVYRGKGKQQAFTEGDPIRYWDDDLLGYMRAEKGESITRIAPFRTSTLVSAAPVEINDDFGVMARADGNPVLHGHEFYRATLVGMFSIDLGAVGTFTYRDRAGYRNLSAAQQEQAAELGLEHVPALQAYRLPVQERFRRVGSLLRALGRLEGGAKQTLHHTDVSPSLVCMAVLRGGNNPFQYLVAPNPLPQIHLPALDEALTVYREDWLSGLVVGLRQGYMDESRAALVERQIVPLHPRQAFDALADELWAHEEWME